MDATREFEPPNSFRWEWIDFHASPAIFVRRRSDPTCKFCFVVLEEDEIAVENVRRKCVEMDENARKNGLLA